MVKYMVRLTPEERATVVDPGDHRASRCSEAAPCADPAQSRCRAKAGAAGPTRRLLRPWTPAPPPSIGCARPWVEQGLEAALARKRPYGPAVSQAGWCPGGPADRRGLQCAPGRPGAVDAHVIGGQAGGTGRRRHHQCGVCPHHAQKNDLKPWQHKQWVIPPQANAAFVCAMEDVLEVYTRPYDPRRPQVCVDETSKQLVAETRAAHPGGAGAAGARRLRVRAPGHSQSVHGLRAVGGATAGEGDGAAHGGGLRPADPEVVDEQYPQAEKIVLVMDNLNTHKPASLYEAFATGRGPAADWNVWRFITPPSMAVG